MEDSPTDFAVTLLLCDSAQAVAGKLYVLGGGWTHIVQNAPAQMGLAIRIHVPWDRANHPLAVEVQLLTEDGEPVDAGDGPVRALAQLEVGRPPGVRRGAPLSAVLAVNTAPLALAAGRYVWVLAIDGRERAREPFEVAANLF